MKHKILIVDDEPDICDSLELSLELDYDVLTANTGAEGLELLQQNEIALIISDQRMPKMTGVEFLARAQEISPSTVRLMLTGFADFDAIIEAINKGQIYRYISKPWEPAKLEIDVRQAVERYAIQASLDRRVNELQALCDISAAITSTLNSGEVIPKILDGVVHALGFDRAYLMILDQTDRVVDIKAILCCSSYSSTLLPPFPNFRKDSLVFRRTRDNGPPEGMALVHWWSTSYRPRILLKINSHRAIIRRVRPAHQ